MIQGFSNELLEKLGIPPELANQFSNYVIIPLDKIVKASWNYKDEDEEKSEKLSNNLERNGQLENIIVRELEDGMFEVGNGNHRLDEYEKKGWGYAIAYNCGKISESEMKRIAIETNETKFPIIRPKLGGILAELNNEFDDLELTMPFLEAEMESYLMIAEMNQPSSGSGSGDLPPEKLPEDTSITEDRMEELAILAGYKTAIARSKPSKPIQFYEKNQLLEGEVLDYGSGHEVHDYAKFDPVHEPNYELLRKKWDTIMCNYVLNVIPLPHNRFELVLAVLQLLKGYGTAYFAIYDKKQEKDTESSKGFQCGWSIEDWDSFFKRFDGERMDKAKFPCWKIVKSVDTIDM